MSEWVMLVPLKVFTRIKNDFSQELKAEYGMSDAGNFSMVANSNVSPSFPFVFVTALPAVEKGADMQGLSINGAQFTFQIDVTDNKTQSRARKVMTEVLRIMKSMGFEATEIPSFEGTQDNTHRMIARFRRTIGEGDVL